MALTRVVNGILREVWQQTTSLDGGSSEVVTTGIPCTIETLAKIAGYLILTEQVGAPEISAALSVAAGHLVVTITNAAVAGNSSTWQLSVMRVHSLQQAARASDPPAPIIVIKGGNTNNALNVVTPEQFGARPGLDATAAIQNAANSLVVGGRSGGEVLFTQRYLISSAITVPPNVTFRGVANPIPNGDALPHTSPMTGNGVLLSTNYADFSFLILSDGSSVENLGFDSAVDNPVLTGGSVIDASGTSGVRLSNIWINRAYDAIVVVDALHYFNSMFIQGLQIFHLERYGLHLVHAVGVYLDGFQMLNWAVRVNSVAFQLEESVATVMVTNGTIWGVAKGIIVLGGAPGSQLTEADDLHFANFDIDQSRVGPSVALSNAFNVSFTGMWIGASASDGIQLNGTCQDISIHDCTILLCSLGGISILTTTVLNVKIHDNTIHSNNTSNNLWGMGIYVVADATHFSIRGNRITNTSLYGLGPGHQKYAIMIGAAANASDYYVVDGNIVDGNEMGGVLDNGAGVNKIVNNVG